MIPAGSLSAGIPVLAPVDVSSGVITPPGNILSNAFNPYARHGYVQSFNFTVEQEVAKFVISASYVGTLGRRIPGTLNMNVAGPGATVNDRPLAKLYGRTADTNLQDFMLSNAYHALQTRVQRRFGSMGSVTGVASAILGGFRLSGVLSARTGTPVNITGTRLAANAGQGFTNHPSSTGPVKYLYGTGRGQLWFDTSTFVEPVPGTLGAVGRNTVRGPGLVNWNLTLSRIFRFTERYRLEMSMAAFNVTNTTHFNDPSGSFTGSFGVITSSYKERQVRLGARLRF